MSIKRIFSASAIVVIPILLAGCAASGEEDLRTWMSEQGANARGKIDVIPAMRPYEPFAYNAFDQADPFKPRKIETGKGANAPDTTRRKEALEGFPLESLSMVGTLQRGRTVVALIKTSDNRVFQARQGNHAGQNFGVITAISDSEVTLKELFQDGAGDWAERQTKMMLQEREQSK
ncbi:MAG TPA: pilus assembly protein PilP [Casimicrobium sp.]|nr:pilus assembly protein PilP [Casimicrobium sp.]